MATLGRSGLASAVVLALLLVAAPGWAGQPTDQLRTEIDRVLKVLDDPELKKERRARERQAEVRRIANDIFDFEETARRSLARHRSEERRVGNGYRTREARQACKNQD